MTARRNTCRSTKQMPWPIRAVQLDVARHMETPDYICRYADFAARHGFNTLVLYLEGRVRTKTFPFRPRKESYSLQDMEQVVTHARVAGLDVVPVVSTLGHCEQFLACKELAHLAETRDGRARFGQPRPNPDVFCTALNETYAFFEAYFKELAQVFTGPHWHVGLDESWDMGFCDLCRERWAAEGLGSIFTRHVVRNEQMLRKLGKRMWMWDDFYELFPDELKKTPRRVVQCHWGYEDLVDLEGQKAHFVNRWRQDWLTVYEQLGLDVIVCPARNYWNIQNFTDYARRHRVLGGLLTQWEGTARLKPGNSAVISFGGHLWNNKIFDPEQAWLAGIKDIIPGASAPLAQAVQELVRLPRCAYQPTSTVFYRWTKDDIVYRAAVRMALELLRSERAKNPAQPGGVFLDDLEFGASRNLLLWDLRELALAINHPRRPLADLPRLTRHFEACRAEMRQLLGYWQAYYKRRGDPANSQDRRINDYWHKLAGSLNSLLKRLQKPMTDKNWLLVLRLFLQDYNGAPQLKISVSVGSKRIQVAAGSFKHGTLLLAGHTGGHYALQIPFVSARQPDGVQLEAWGYGGQGVAFVELQNPSVTLMPGSIRSISGPVSHSEAVLRDDSACACLGYPDILAAMHYPMLAEHRAVLDLGMSKCY